MYQLVAFALSLLLFACGHRTPPVDSGAPHAPAPLVRSLPIPPLEEPHPYHVTPRPAHPLVQRCVEQEQVDWDHLKGCLTSVAHDVVAADDGGGVDAAHKLKGPSPFPPNFNPAWLIPAIHYDNASRLATCSDENTGINSAHPLCTRQQWLSRWGTDAPVLRQTTAEFAHSSWPRNPAVDQFEVRVRVQNQAQYSFQGDLIQVASGTLSGVVAKNRNTPQRLNVTLASGLTTPTLIVDTSRTSYAWIVFNSSGNAWDMSQPQTESTIVPANVPPAEDDGWTNGDNYVAYTLVNVPLRRWAVSWEDLADFPDTRPVAANFAVAQGVTNGSDTALVRFDVMGDALVNIAFLNAGGIYQNDYVHGSRAGAAIINPYGCGAGSTGDTGCADGNAVRMIIAGNNGGIALDKQPQIYGGKISLPFLGNVGLQNDFQADNGIVLNGNNSYTGIYIGPAGQVIAQNGGSLIPDARVSTAYLWGPGELDPFDHATFVYTDPASTSLQQKNAFTCDNAFTASACDFTHNFEMCVPGLALSTSISSLDTLLATSIAAGGYGGTVYCPFGSMITDNPRHNDTTTPFFKFDGGIQGFGCGPGQDCTIVGSGTGVTVAGSAPITVTGGPAYNVALTTPLSAPNGGSGVASPTAHNVPVAEGASAFTLEAPGASNTCLCSNGASSDPTFQQIAYSNISGTPTIPTVASGNGITVTGGPAYTVSINSPLAVQFGGTGQNSLITHATLIGEGTAQINQVGPSVTGNVLTSNGGSSDPSYQPLPSASLLPGSVSTSGTCTGTCSTTPTSVSTIGFSNLGQHTLSTLTCQFSNTNATAINGAFCIGVDSTTTCSSASYLTECAGSTVSVAATGRCDGSVVYRATVTGSHNYSIIVSASTSTGSGGGCDLIVQDAL